MSESVANAVENALANALSDEGDMVTKWVLVAEVIGDEGQRGVWTLAPDDAAAWDTLGLLTWAVQLEQAAAVQQAMDDDD